MKKPDINYFLTMTSSFCIVIIFIRQFILYDTPEVIKVGHEFGELFFNISVGVLVTHWFYYLTIYRREKRYKDKAYKLVNKRTKSIVTSFHTLKSNIYEANKPIFETIGIEMDTAYNYGQILKFINPAKDSGKLDGAFQPMNWAVLITRANNRIEQAIKDIFIVMPHLEAEDIELFTDLYDSRYLETVNNIDLSGSSDIGFLGQDMYDFNIMIEKIESKFGKN
jgi:hypothetical protein